jgi:transcriptional regulator with XRE-family HTH domain
MGALQQKTHPADAPTTLTKAVVRAAGLLQISQASLADILGVSGATASRLVGGNYALQPTRKREWEFALLFVRLYRSLDAIVGHDRDAQTWLRNTHLALGAKPLELIRSAEGLVRVLHYLDAHRGRV